MRVFVPIVLLTLAACGKKTPPEVQAILDAQHAAAVKVALDSAAVCPSDKAAAPFMPEPIKAPPPPANPAKGTSLESEKKVVDVLVTCSWPDPRSPGAFGGTSLHPLKGTDPMRARAVTMTDDMSVNTCKNSPHDCEQVIVPSRYSSAEKSADLRIVRPTSDGGEAEVIVVIVP